jgi:hypothetical protein
VASSKRRRLLSSAPLQSSFGNVSSHGVENNMPNRAPKSIAYAIALAAGVTIFATTVSAQMAHQGTADDAKAMLEGCRT